MDSFLKGFKKGKPASRHSKLSDKWGSEKQSVKEGVSFTARYLGSILVEELDDESQSYGHSISADAVKTIVTMSKASGKKSSMSIKVSYRGIVVTDMEANKVFTNLDIHRINFCTADKHHNKVFAYVARNTENETMECHAFLCAKRKVAEAITITVAQAFHLAKEMIEKRQEAEQEKKNQIICDSTSAADSDHTSETSHPETANSPFLSLSTPAPASYPPVLEPVQPIPAPPMHHHPLSSSPSTLTAQKASSSSPLRPTPSLPQQIPRVPPRQPPVMGFEDNFTPPVSSYTPPSQSLAPNICNSPASTRNGFEDNFSDAHIISQLPRPQPANQPHTTVTSSNNPDPLTLPNFNLGPKHQGLEHDFYQLSLSHNSSKQQFSTTPTVDDLLCL